MSTLGSVEKRYASGRAVASLTPAFFAVGLYAVGCSSTSSTSHFVTSSLRGTYYSLSGGDVSEITFVDTSHYTLLRSNCGGPEVDGAGDNGCQESGTYALNLATGILSLTSSVNHVTRSLPFSAQSVEAASDPLGTLGGMLATGDAGALTRDAGSLTSSTSLIACFGSALNEGDPTSRTFGLHCPIANEVTREGMLARAQLWVNAELPYCQAPNNTADGDKECASVCQRPGEPAAWDAYRSDCSAFVSWAWGLPPPGRTTRTFGDVTTTIMGDDLQPGDALNRFGVHVILFLSWVDASHTSAVFQEEPGCSANPNFAHEFTSTVKIDGSSVFVTHNGETFEALRFTGICSSPCQVTAPPSSSPPATGSGSGSTPPPAPTVSCTTQFGAHGECIDSSMCTAMGGSPVSDLCPGDDNIQCCTIHCNSPQTFLGAFGECIDAALCKSIGGTPTANLCPGSDNIECCSK